MDPAESRRQREEMVRSQIKARGIHDPRVLDAMLAIPRELFLPRGQEGDAYYDGALSIGLGQTISQPYIVGLMTEALESQQDDLVLEVGTGSGYQTAILCLLCRWVYTFERLEPLVEVAGKRLDGLGLTNVTLLTGDGSAGFPKEASYDGIIVTAAPPRVPKTLCDQLSADGRLVIPVGDRSHQVLYQIRRRGEEFTRKHLCDCVFVPLLGQEGWDEEDARSSY